MSTSYRLSYAVGFHPWEDLTDHQPFAMETPCPLTGLDFVARLVPNSFCGDPGWQRAEAHDVVEPG